MAIFKNQSYVSKVAAFLLAVSVMCTPGFSVSAQTVSDENSKNTETQIREEFFLPNGDTLKAAGDATIDVIEAVKVKIKVGERKYRTYKVPKSTVENVLDYANIDLGKNDTVNKKLSTKVENGTKIKIDRISYIKEVKKQKVSFKTIEKSNNKMYVGQEKVIRKGKNGTKNVTYTSKIVNGRLVTKKITKTNTIKKPVKEIVQVGTKSRGYMLQQNNTQYNTKSTGGIGTFIDNNGKKVAYKKKITGQATAYCCGSITATGDPVKIGGVAVNPRQIPYGSKLYIETADGNIIYGYAVANDTGGFATAGTATVDLYYNSLSVCNNFGRRIVNIYVLA